MRDHLVRVSMADAHLHLRPVATSESMRPALAELAPSAAGHKRPERGERPRAARARATGDAA